MEFRCKRHGNLVSTARPYRPDSDDCYECWPRETRRAARPAGPVPPPVPSRGPCLHLGQRVEYRPGCGGRNCRHLCLAGEPEAVPGGVCQTCNRYEPENESP